MIDRVSAGLLCLLLSGCGGMNLASVSSIEGARGISLSRDQHSVIKAGVREIVARVAREGSQSARLQGVNGFRSVDASLINICGEVSYKSAGGGVVTVPFFLELAEKSGSPFAKRGQVGFDKLKKAKVVYLCKKANGT